MSESIAAKSLRREVLLALDEVLCLGGRGLGWPDEAPLLGAIPELDSMAVVSLITTLQDRIGVAFRDDDLDGDAFRTVGALVRRVGERLAGP